MKTRRPAAPRLAAVLLACAALLAAAPASLADSLQSEIERIIRAGELGSASLGLLVLDAETGEVMASHDADMPLIPASNMKLTTTAAALETLGADFVFSTQLRLHERTLIVRGNGDPAFGDPVLLEAMGLTVEQLLGMWVDAVKRAGVEKVDAIVVDDRAFDRMFIHPAWPTDQLLRWYCAQVGAINFNDNCLDIYAAPTSPSERPDVEIVPEHAAVTLENAATSGSENAFWAWREPGTNRITLRGTVEHRFVEPINVTIHDPPMFFGETLAQYLEEAGVEVGETRRVEPRRILPEGELLAAVETTLPTIVVRCNRDSQNLFAEAIFKHLGHDLTGRPGSWANGAAAVRGYLAGVLDAETVSAVALDDGSGMSRHNRLSARALAELLTHMHEQAEIGDIYRRSLAVPGETGTLDDRFNGIELESAVRAKSGYLNGVVALSGYVTLGERTAAFSMLLNGYRKGVWRAKRMMEKIVDAVDDQLAASQPVKLGG